MSHCDQLKRMTSLAGWCLRVGSQPGFSSFSSIFSDLFSLFFPESSMCPPHPLFPLHPLPPQADIHPPPHLLLPPLPPFHSIYFCSPPTCFSTSTFARSAVFVCVPCGCCGVMSSAGRRPGLKKPPRLSPKRCLVFLAGLPPKRVQGSWLTCSCKPPPQHSPRSKQYRQRHRWDSRQRWEMFSLSNLSTDRFSTCESMSSAAVEYNDSITRIKTEIKTILI